MNAEFITATPFPLFLIAYLLQKYPKGIKTTARVLHHQPTFFLNLLLLQQQSKYNLQKGHHASTQQFLLLRVFLKKYFNGMAIGSNTKKEIPSAIPIILKRCNNFCGTKILIDNF